MHTENDNTGIGIGTADLIANIVVYLQYSGIGTTLKIANIVVYLQYSGIGTTLKSIHTLMMVGRKLGNIPHLPTYLILPSLILYSSLSNVLLQASHADF